MDDHDALGACPPTIPVPPDTEQTDDPHPCPACNGTGVVPAVAFA
jgi:hypothetical protein